MGDGWSAERAIYDFISNSCDAALAELRKTDNVYDEMVKRKTQRSGLLRMLEGEGELTFSEKQRSELLEFYELWAEVISREYHEAYLCGARDARFFREYLGF